MVPVPATVRPVAGATRVRRPVPAARSVPASKAARCLWPVVSPSVASTTSTQSGDVVDAAALIEKGILNDCPNGLKVLSNGTLTKKVTVNAAAFSASAKEKIEQAGGKAQVV